MVYDFDAAESSNLDTPWADDPMQATNGQEAEWTQISSSFANVRSK